MNSRPPPYSITLLARLRGTGPVTVQELAHGTLVLVALAAAVAFLVLLAMFGVGT